MSELFWRTAEKKAWLFYQQAAAFYKICRTFSLGTRGLHKITPRFELAARMPELFWRMVWATAPENRGVLQNLSDVFIRSLNNAENTYTYSGLPCNRDGFLPYAAPSTGAFVENSPKGENQGWFS
jgi:hypothetical protein